VKGPQKTQRQVVLEMLENRGAEGVHSFEFIQARIPRVAARVCELRAEGHSIDSEPEALHGAAKGVRYTLTNSGVDTGSGPEPRAASVHSGVEASSALPVSTGEAPPESLFDLPPAPSAFDPWERAA
jgi:hypothetical protein